MSLTDEDEEEILFCETNKHNKTQQ